MRYRLLAVLLIFGFFLGVGFALFQNHKHLTQDVYIKLPKGVKASIYKDLGGDGAYNYDAASAPEYSLSGSDTVRLERVAYDVVLGNQDQYSSPVTKTYIGYSTKEVDVPAAYSDQKLAQLLPSQRQAALSSLYAKYPLMRTSYDIKKDALYGLGDWYGVVLQPKQPQIDTIRVILHKENNKWVVKTLPQISIGAPSNPSVPYSVIDSVDQL